jgi:predicted DsbA family dithiol-disulfide isomerase
MNSRTVHVEIVSDFACPWCLVGHRRLASAIRQRPDLDIVIEWSPFQLNPGMPREGRNRREYYHGKFGAGGYRNLRGSLDSAGLEEGIVFCDTPDAMAPNTLSAHTLMYWASQEGGTDTNALAEKLLKAHHVDCENIGDQEVLVRIAAEVGMDTTRVASKLANGDDEDVVRGQIDQSMNRGVTGVPFFIINNRYALTGAQPASTFLEAFDQL